MACLSSIIHSHKEIVNDHPRLTMAAEHFEIRLVKRVEWKFYQQPGVELYELAWRK